MIWGPILAGMLSGCGGWKAQQRKAPSWPQDPPFAPLGKGGWRNQVWVLAVCFIEKKCLMKTIYYRSADSARKGALWVVVMRQSPKAVLWKKFRVVCKPPNVIARPVLWAEAIPIFPSEWEIASQKPLA